MQVCNVQVYVMTNKWRFKPMQRMDLGASNQQGISLTTQKSNSGAVNGTAVTAAGRFGLSLLCFTHILVDNVHPSVPTALAFCRLA